MLHFASVVTFCGVTLVSIFQQISHWGSNFRQITCKLLQVVYHAEKPLYILLAGWCWHLCDILYLVWIRLETILTYNMSHKLYFFAPKLKLIFVQLDAFGSVQTRLSVLHHDQTVLLLRSLQHQKLVYHQILVSLHPDLLRHILISSEALLGRVRFRMVNESIWTFPKGYQMW